jgi:hypothetical protein
VFANLYVPVGFAVLASVAVFLRRESRTYG